MREMLEMSPLSPVRECAMSRSLNAISALHNLNSGFHEVFRQKSRADSDDVASGLRYSTTAGWAVEVQRLHLVSDPSGLTKAVGSADNSNPYLAGLRRIS